MRRSAVVPKQYKEKRAYFFESRFYVDERVLIPRPETEILVEAAQRVAKNYFEIDPKRAPAFLDLCTGSGNIAISLTRSLNLDTMVACDISQEALSVARINAMLHGISQRIDFIASDLFENIDGTFDIIVSNPPYVGSEEFDLLPEEVLAEPRVALDGGPGGMLCLRRILAAAPDYLRPNGWLIMEIGHQQYENVASEAGQAGNLRIVETIKDYHGINRVIVARRDG